MRRLVATLIGAGALLAPAISAAAPEAAAATPAELVATYQSLADTILGAKRSEHGLVKSILAATYRHAEAAHASAQQALKSGQNARASIEKLAALVAQIGNEGDAAVAAVRTRLLEGGHHHNAEGEQQGIYDEGFVIITRAAKKSFLDSAQRIGKLAAAPEAKSLETEWSLVARSYGEFVK